MLFCVKWNKKYCRNSHSPPRLHPPLPQEPLLSSGTCRRWAAACGTSSWPGPWRASARPWSCSSGGRNPGASPLRPQTPRPPPSAGGQDERSRSHRSGSFIICHTQSCRCFTSCIKMPDLLWSHQQQLGDGRGGGHGVPVHSVDLEGSGHAPHPLVGGQNLLIPDQNSVWVFDCGQTKRRDTLSWKVSR